MYLNRDRANVFKSDLTSFELVLAGLEVNGISTIFCEIDNNPYIWLYHPNIGHASHHVICTWNFAKSNNAPGKTTCIIEISGEVGVEKIKRQLQIAPCYSRYLTHSFSPCGQAVVC